MTTKIPSSMLRNALQLGSSAAANLAAWQSAFDSGGAYTFGPGLYPIAQPVTSDYAGAPTLGTHDTKRFDILGQSRNNTTVHYSGTGYWLTAVGGSEGHSIQAFDRLSNFSLLSADYKNNYGITYALKVCPEISDIYMAGFKDALRLDGVFAAKIDNLKIADCENGLVFADVAGLGSCNLVQVNKSNFEACSNIGIDGVAVGDNIVLNCIDVEGCGTHGNAATGGVFLSLQGSNGPGPLKISDSYFELNRGGFDLYIENAQDGNAVAIIDGCFFNRADAANHTTSNIVLRNTGAGTLRVVVRGCAFYHTGNYVPSASQPYFDIGTGCELIDGGGNSYSSVVPLPAGPATRPGATSEVFCGAVAADGTAGMVPRGVTVAKIATGAYTVTHALGWGIDTNAYFPTATSASETSGLLVQRVRKVDAAHFAVYTTDVEGTATDCPFTFQVARLA